jgi:restriction system protein
VAIPDYQSIMFPLLEMSDDKQEHSLREAIDSLGALFGLSEGERRELLPSGRQATFDNRVGWARTYLAKAGLLETRGRGRFCIAPAGIELLQRKPGRINIALLDKYPGFKAFRSGEKHEPVEPPTSEAQDQTPEELLEQSFELLQSALARDLRALVAACSPKFFEVLVIDLLLAMGYGGSRREAGEAVGRSGDGGIDGIIKEDRLGLDSIFVQAKWSFS